MQSAWEKAGDWLGHAWILSKHDSRASTLPRRAGYQCMHTAGQVQPGSWVAMSWCRAMLQAQQLTLRPRRYHDTLLATMLRARLPPCSAVARAAGCASGAGTAHVRIGRSMPMSNKPGMAWQQRPPKVVLSLISCFYNHSSASRQASPLTSQYSVTSIAQSSRMQAPCRSVGRPVRQVNALGITWKAAR